MKLKNKIAVVTGASSGMGKDICLRFLKEGAIVFGCGIEDSIDYNHQNMTYKKLDIRSYESCNKFIEDIAKEHKQIDILINSAGITTEGNLEETTIESFQFQFEVNVNGTFNMCKSAITYMKNKPSAIVNIASDLGLKPAPRRCAYAPTKAAIILLTQSIAVDYAPFVRANTIMPGLVDTPMIQSRFEEADNPDELRALYESFYLSKRLGKVSDITNGVMFLVSDDNTFITGDNLAICGGSLIK